MKNFFLSALMLAAALGFAGCQKDNTPAGGGPDAPELSKTIYAHIKISNSDITRAANQNDNDFEDGTLEENTVSNMLIVFYDQNETIVGYYNDKEWNQSADPDTSDDFESKLEWKDAEVVPIKMLRPGEPFYAIAFLNYDENWRADLTGDDSTIGRVSSIVKETYSRIVTGEDGKKTSYFLMTNSGRFDSDDNYCIATKIEGFVFPTPEEAKNSPAITIYVERAAARVDFKIADNAANKYTVYYSNTEYELQFTPEHWGLTATENQNYILKNMKSKHTDYAGTGYAAGFSEWINYLRHRTYWAETPRYGSYIYPHSGAGMDVKFPDVSLDYIDYTELAGSTITMGAADFSSKYTFEHTFDAKDLRSEVNPYAVPTSIVFDGRYIATKSGGGAQDPDSDTDTPDSAADVLDFNGAGFYLRTIANTKQLYLEKNAAGKNDLLVTYLNEQTVIFTKDAVADGNEPTYSLIGYDEQTAADFEIANTNKFYFTDGTTAESSNAHTLQLKAGAAGDYYLRTYVDAKGQPGDADYAPARYEYTPITAATLAEANAEIQKNVGSAFKYNNGRAFFYIPVLHYIARESYPENEDGSLGYTGTFAADQDGTVINKTGEFGIVRNHIYRLTIDRIDGLGSGDPGTGDFKPIPDPEENKQWFFHAKLEILSWHVVEFTFGLK